MVSILASGAVDRGSEPRSDQIKDCRIGIFCFFAKGFSRKKYLGGRNSINNYTPRKQSLGGVYRNHPVCSSVHVPCKRNSSSSTYWIFMKLYTFVVHYLQMCLKEYGCCPKYKKGDSSTYTFTKRVGMYLVNATTN